MLPAAEKWGRERWTTRVLQLVQVSPMLPVVDLDIYRESNDASLVAAEARKVRPCASPSHLRPPVLTRSPVYVDGGGADRVRRADRERL